MWRQTFCNWKRNVFCITSKCRHSSWKQKVHLAGYYHLLWRRRVVEFEKCSCCTECHGSIGTCSKLRHSRRSRGNSCIVSLPQQSNTLEVKKLLWKKWHVIFSFLFKVLSHPQCPQWAKSKQPQTKKYMGWWLNEWVKKIILILTMMMINHQNFNYNDVN